MKEKVLVSTMEDCGSEHCCHGNKNFKKIKDVKPFGSGILVQRLNPDEVLGTSLYIGEDAKQNMNQGQVRVVAIGSSLKADELGIKVGDRLLATGTSTLVPSLDGGKHEYNVLEIHNIKAILVEE